MSKPSSVLRGSLYVLRNAPISIILPRAQITMTSKHTGEAGVQGDGNGIDDELHGVDHEL